MICNETRTSGNRGENESDRSDTRAREHKVDISIPWLSPDPVELLHREWAEQVGELLPIPPVTAPPGVEATYRVAIAHSRVDDVAVEDLYSEAILGGTGGRFNHLNGRVIAHLVQRGEWRFTDFRGQATTSASAGELCIRYNDPPWEFEIDPATRAQVLQLPAEELRPHIGDQAIVISQAAPEVRILTAYVSSLTESLNELSDAAVGHARNAVIELFKGVLAHRVVADEPQLATALVAAAKQLAETRLLDGDLNPRDLAKALNVSVRTLHRAFAATDESIMSFVRARRLERARLEMTAPGAPLSVAEVAARWQFSDNSHFTRAFRQRYGVTPTQYVRRARSPSGRPPALAPDSS